MRNKWDTFMAVADLERFFKTITADVVYIQWCIVLTWIASLASGISLSKSCASFAANITSSVVLRLYVQGTWELFVWTVQRCLCYAFYGTFIKFASTFHLRAYVVGPISTLHYLVWLYFCSLFLSLNLFFGWWMEVVQKKILTSVFTWGFLEKFFCP